MQFFRKFGNFHEWSYIYLEYIIAFLVHTGNSEHFLKKCLFFLYF